VASEGEKVNVDLDAEIVARTRDRLGAADESDATVVERALNAYLLGRLLDVAQAKAGLSEAEAEKLAVNEVRAARRERSSAA
jgi:predicted transcriptional regulator